MKGFLNNIVIAIIMLLSSACSIQHQCMSHQQNTQNTAPQKQIFNYAAPAEDYKNIKQPSIHVPTNAYPTENKILYQNPDSGTSSTGPR